MGIIAVEYDEAIVKLLLDTGKVDVDARDTKYGRTPLFLAVKEGYDAIVRLLFEYGADMEGTSDTGWTALQLASLNAHAEVESFLLSRGASVPPDFFGIKTLFSQSIY